MQLKRTHIIAMANQKGGCGKTTGAVSLAAALAERGLRVCLIDTDPQCNATDSFGISRDDLAQAGHFTLADVYVAKKPAREIQLDFGDRFQGRLTLIAGHRGLTTAESRLESELQTIITNEDFSHLDADDIRQEHRSRMRASLDTLRDQCDVVVIDTPPDLGFLMTTALIAADRFIIPIFPSGYDLKGLETLIQTVQKVKNRYNPKLHLLGVLLGNFDTRAKLDTDIRNILDEQFGPGVLFDTMIHRSVRHREATVYARTIVEHAAGQLPAEQFLAVADEVIGRLRASEAKEEDARVLREVNRG